MNSKERFYFEAMEQAFLENLQLKQVTPLCDSMKKNNKWFSFISERKFALSVGAYNMKCDKVAKIVEKQLTAYNAIIETLSKFEDMPLSETMQQGIFRMVRPIKELAIQYGYCDEAVKLVKITKNPKLVGACCGRSAKEDILSILDAYGKRFILERDEELAEKAEQLVVDVAVGVFGRDTREELSMQEMDSAYKNATVVKSDVVFHTDGTHHWKAGVGKN